jgi:hypothetical protein
LVARPAGLFLRLHIRKSSAQTSQISRALQYQANSRCISQPHRNRVPAWHLVSQNEATSCLEINSSMDLGSMAPMMAS